METYNNKEHTYITAKLKYKVSFPYLCGFLSTVSTDYGLKYLEKCICSVPV
jgi:hypothetical protein